MSDVSDSLDAFARWAKTIERRIGTLEKHEHFVDWGDGTGLQTIGEALKRVEAQAKPVTVFTARAGETFAIKCEIPSCEVCAAQAKS